MTVEQGQHKYIIAPSKFLLIVSLFIVATVILQLFLLSILPWYKWAAICVVALCGVLFIRRFQAAKVNYLIYKPSDNQWILNGNRLRLRSDQFITRNLIIIYFIADNGKKITQPVPADALTPQQHINLRRLLISCSQSR